MVTYTYNADLIKIGFDFVRHSSEVRAATQSKASKLVSEKLQAI